MYLYGVRDGKDGDFAIPSMNFYRLYYLFINTVLLSFHHERIAYNCVATVATVLVVGLLLFS